MSGLLVKFMVFMKDNFQVFNEVGIDVFVIFGGVVFMLCFVQKDCCEVYDGKVIYGCDVFVDLCFMDVLMDVKCSDNWINNKGFFVDVF